MKIQILNATPTHHHQMREITQRMRRMGRAISTMERDQ
jgi:type II secretory pathway component PulJ